VTGDSWGEAPRARVIERLAGGEALLSLGIRNARTAEVVRMAKAVGFSVVWVDLEHSSMSIDAAAQIVACAADLGLEGWVRVPEREYGMIGRLLDAGATGIVAPRIESVEAARCIVDAARFPPRGHRSQINLLPQTGYRRGTPQELMLAAERATTVHLLIESGAGVRHAAEIAAVDGVDMLHLGLNDLSVDLGCTGAAGDPEVVQAVMTVIAAAKSKGKLAVVGGASDFDLLRRFLDAGASALLFAAIDTEVLATGLQKRSELWRAAWPSRP
jgi:2-keto-3-deoxy-L-rhamnonate aldolase RhmA